MIFLSNVASSRQSVTLKFNTSSDAITVTALPVPVITLVSPLSGTAGTAVTVTGTNFGAGSGTVTINGTAAAISNWSDKNISTSVPALATSGNLVVTSSNGVASNGVSFSIPAPNIGNIAPDSARVGDSVTVTGTNFGTLQGRVSFNGTNGIPASWSNTQIVVPVPTGATTGSVVVTQGGASNSISFTVIPPPSITGISPTSGPVNKLVTVSGSGFGIPQDTGTIQFNGTAGKPFSWSDGSIKVPVPAGAATGPVVVSAGGTNSNGVTFTVTPGPSISSLSISSGAPGAAVTIAGQNFGSSQGNSVVRFNGLPAAVTSWNGNGTSIGVTVPSGVTTGPVTVTVSGQTSNGVTFTAITSGTLSGTVSNSAGGAGIGGATVQALQNGAVKSSATTASAGTYTIANLPSGNYDVQASASGFGTALTNSVGITAGQTSTANFSLSSPGTVSGKVTQPDGVTGISGASVQYFVGSAAGSTSTTDATGSYSISGLNAGSYTLEAGASGYVTQSQAVNVTGGGTATGNFSLQALAAKPINYVYDELGRLISVIDSSGDTAKYKYDAVGNILSISRQNSNLLSIISFTPQSGPTGASVTIYGTGFSVTASQDSVAFNGVSATVISATATQITTTVPSAATTGPIAVTTPAGSVSSSTNFTVGNASGAPTITGFTPPMGTTGTAVSISGTNFDVVTNDKVTFNVSYAGASSATGSQIGTTVPVNTASGRISVATPTGNATSTQDFYIPFGTHTVGDIGYTGRLANGSTQTVTLAASKIGLLLFDGISGQGASLQLSGSTFSSCTLYLFAPDGTQLNVQVNGGAVSTSASCTSGTTLIGSEPEFKTGTYTIGIDPGTSAGSISIGLTPDVSGTISAGGASVPVTTVQGQDARLTFTGTFGQRIAVLASSVSNPVATLNLVRPDGVTQASVNISSPSSSFLDTQTLQMNGTYTLWVQHAGTYSGSETIQLYNVPPDFTGSITPVASGGPTVTVPANTEGQNTNLTFSGTNGQRVSLRVTNITYGCSVLSPGVNFTIINPDNNTKISLGNICVSSGGSGYFDVTNLTQNGTYTLLVDPQGASTGGATLQLNNVPPDATGTITIGGPAVMVSTDVAAAGQNTSLSFSGTANQVISLQVSSISYACTTLSPGVNFTVSTGSTTVFTGNICGTSGSFNSKTLPAITGTYNLLVDPRGANTGSAMLTLTSQ
jgi:YD repeat-containing protein